MLDRQKQLEPDIKAAVINRLLASGWLSRGDTVGNEFTLRYSRRADLVVAERGRLLGFEIKSESDSLKRLEGQIDTYRAYFDKVIVVAAPKHIPTILKASPWSVEVWECHNAQIKVRKRGKVMLNKDHAKLLDLLTARELAVLAREVKIKPAYRARRGWVEALLSAPIGKIRAAVMRAFEQRYDLSSKDFWEQVGDKAATAVDTEYLSPYHQDRIAIKESIKKRDDFLNTLNYKT